MKYIVKFKMSDGKEGQTQPFSSLLAAELAQMAMPLPYVVSSEIIEKTEGGD